MIMFRPSFDRAFPFAVIAVVTAFAGCTHVSLKEQPQVLDWSSGTQTTIVPAQQGDLPRHLEEPQLRRVARAFSESLAHWELQVHEGSLFSLSGNTPSGLTPLALLNRQESATTGRRVATEPVEMKSS